MNWREFIQDRAMDILLGLIAAGVLLYLAVHS